mmetsp:Transcript_38573/g.109085  ORF Transcript_38573/g.109085 Transcript_38573/m.109085 type:complete len:234 (-) Transcript_38573:41-742(-)
MPCARCGAISRDFRSSRSVQHPSLLRPLEVAAHLLRLSAKRKSRGQRQPEQGANGRAPRWPHLTGPSLEQRKSWCPAAGGSSQESTSRFWRNLPTRWAGRSAPPGQLWTQAGSATTCRLARRERWWPPTCILQSAFPGPSSTWQASRTPRQLWPSTRTPTRQFSRHRALCSYCTRPPPFPRSLACQECILVRWVNCFKVLTHLARLPVAVLTDCGDRSPTMASLETCLTWCLS